MAEWLKRCGIRTVAMQSTGVYWVAVQESLEREGFEVCLVNARGTKNLPGRKSDVQECRWLMKLHTSYSGGMPWFEDDAFWKTFYPHIFSDARFSGGVPTRLIV